LAVLALAVLSNAAARGKRLRVLNASLIKKARSLLA
jgi:hypothetical protein